MDLPDLSVVIPVYNGSTTIGRLVGRLVELFAQERLEIVLVNDCSPDDSDRVCRELVAQHPAVVTYVLLARNFGEHNAVMAGLNYATGDHVVVMDDDFQNPPEEVPRLVEKAREGGYDVVYTFYSSKRHTWFRNLGSRLQNWMAGIMLDKPKGLYLSSFKCMSRFAVSEVTRYTGPFPYVDGLLLRVTQSIGTLEARHEARAEGVSGYTPRKLLRVWLNMFLNFSVMPLRLLSLLGIGLVVLGALLGLAVVIERWISPETPVGWASLVVVIVTFSGGQLLMLGLLGEYVGHLFLSVNQTPQYVVRGLHQRKAVDA